MMSLFARAGLILGSSLTAKPLPLGRDRTPVDLYPRIGDERWSDRSLESATWAFVGFGVVIRLIRYMLVHPLWGDESFVAVNLINRGYLDLLKPLDYQQVCPILFLWIELTVVKVLGFSEWSLRLFPMFCGIATLFAFRHLASRVMTGLPLLFAVAIVAVATNPLRHSGEVKPYSCDFLVSTVLLSIVVEWWKKPDRSSWLWILVGFTPVAMQLSLPSAFVIGGIGLAISSTVNRVRRPRVTAAYLCFNLAIVAGFLTSLRIYGGSSSWETREYMTNYWSSHFPPWDDPIQLPLWLIRALTGHCFAYPVGGANGASLFTVVCAVLGGFDLVRRGRGMLVSAMVWPLGMALIASSFRYYPFGETERLMQFEGPMICLLAGYGLAWLLSLARRPRRYRRLFAGFVIFFWSIGVGSIVSDMIKPAKSFQDLRAREFARWFWVEVGRDAELVCARRDLGLDFDRTTTHFGRSADYLTLRQIYDPRRRDHQSLGWSQVSFTHPLKCVIYDGVPFDSPLFVRWMELMSRHYRWNRTETYRVNAGDAPKGYPSEDRLAVLVFEPIGVPVDPIAIARNALATNFRPDRGSLQLSPARPDLIP